MPMTEALLFLAAGFAGGAINAAAGGAKLFVFPMLLAAGLPPVAANATATAGLWPGQAMSSLAYRRQLVALLPEAVLGFVIVLVGGLAGALLLLASGDALFMTAIPPLIAVATLTIAFGRRIVLWLPKDATGGGFRKPAAIAVLFLTAVYGGYFGAGMGFMLLAANTLAGHAQLSEANGLKNAMAFAINSIAMVPLALSGLIDWRAAAMVIIGGLVGGYAGGRLAQTVPDRYVRGLVVVIGAVLTLYYLRVTVLAP